MKPLRATRLHYYGVEDRLDHLPSPCQSRILCASYCAAGLLVGTSVALYLTLFLGLPWSLSPLWTTIIAAASVGVACFFSLVCVLTSGRTTNAACQCRLVVYLCLGVLFYLGSAAFYVFCSQTYTLFELRVLIIGLLVTNALLLAAIEILVCGCYRRVRAEKQAQVHTETLSPRPRRALQV